MGSESTGVDGARGLKKYGFVLFIDIAMCFSHGISSCSVYEVLIKSMAFSYSLAIIRIVHRRYSIERIGYFSNSQIGYFLMSETKRSLCDSDIL